MRGNAASYFCIAIFLATARLPVAQEEQTVGYPSVSPDKKWEYRVSGESAVVVKAGSDETVVDLGEEIGHLASKTGKVVWAPDSRRFAFNTRKGGKYYGCELYELKGTTWEKLPELESDARTVSQIIERSIAKQLKPLAAKREGPTNSAMTRWRVRRWLDSDTLEAYASESRRLMLRGGDDWEYVGCAVLFRVKCDNRGGWKITTTRALSDAEAEAIAEADER